MPETNFKLPDTEVFTSARTSLREEYTSYRNALGVRILSFFAVLFTLFQTVVSTQRLSQIFPNLAIVNLEVTAFGINLFNLVKLMVFTVLVIVVLFFSFRTLFHFTLTSRYINELYWFTPEDFNKLPQDIKEKWSEERWPAYLMSALSLKLAGKLDGYDRQKMWFGVPFDFFMPGADYGKQGHGNLLCAFLALLSTGALLFIIW